MATRGERCENSGTTDVDLEFCGILDVVMVGYTRAKSSNTWLAFLLPDLICLSRDPSLELMVPRQLKLLTFFSWVPSAKRVGSGKLPFGAP